MTATKPKSNIVKVEVRYVPPGRIGEIFIKAQLGQPDGFLPPKELDLVDMPGFSQSRRAPNHPKNLETIYKHYQTIDGTPDERPTQLSVRSMTVGDCLVIDGTAYYVADSGFVTKTGDELIPVTVPEE